jgi:hypothetical protein
MDQQIVFGDRMIPVRLPDQTHIVSPGLEGSIPSVSEPRQEIRRALDNPVGLPPLGDLVRPSWKITIAFDDPTVPCYAPVWRLALDEVLKDLQAVGVKAKNITLLCANALHRKFTRRELSTILGEDLVQQFLYRLVCHDAEDPENIVDLGATESGYEVELNRRVAESDLTIYINTAVWRGFNGGWKSICVGLSTYRSIRWHHTPDAMSMSMDRNPMHEILQEMGTLVMEKLGRDRFFKVETVLANPLQIGRVWAGGIDETREEALAFLKEYYVPRRDMVEEKADIVLYGIPDWSPYAAFSRMNPILTLISTGLGYLGGVIEAMGKPGCSVVLATPCPDRWDEARHPSYREVWDRVLAYTRDPYEIRDWFEEDFAHRTEYIYRYRYCFGFHPIHGIMATYPLKRLRHASRVYVAGTQDPHLVRHLDFEPTPTVEDALERAMSVHGRNASIVFIPYPLVRSRQ